MKDRSRRLFLLVVATVMLFSALVPAEVPLSHFDPHIGPEWRVNPFTYYTYTATVNVHESGLNSDVSSWGAYLHGTENSASGSAAPGETITLVAEWKTSQEGGGISFEVDWDSVPGWNTPSYQVIFASPGGTYSVTGTYTPFSVSITASKTTLDANQADSFSISSNTGTSPFSYQWYLNGNPVSGATSSTWNPTSLPSGSDTVYVIVYGASSYAQSNTVGLTVDSSLSLSISPSHNPADEGQSIAFDAIASGGSGSYSSYSYVLYDGTSTSDSQLASGSTSSFLYSFSSTGQFLLDYSVTDSNGNTVSASLTETVNTDPSVSISSSQNPTDVGKTITLSSSVSGGTSPYSYQWYLNGNAISGATSSTYSVSYSSSGTYDYYVAVTDAAGYTVDSNTIDETVNTGPTVSASSNVSTADVGYPIEFSATPSGGTSPYTYSWIIGGSQVSTSQDFSYTFSSAGSYTVTVTVTDAVGETYSASVTVTINNNPSVSVSSSQNPTDVGNSVTFTASESGGTGSISYAWYVNGASEGSGSTLSYSFSSSGSYTIEVVVTDSDGHTASYTISEYVFNPPSVYILNDMTPGVFYVYSYTSAPYEGAVPYSEIASYPLIMPDSFQNNVSTWTGTFVDGGFGYDYGNPAYNGQTFLGRPNVPYPSSLSVLNTEPSGGAYDEGYVAVTVLYFGGGTYTFYGEYDDNGAIWISDNGVNWISVLGDNAWHSEGATEYSGTETLSAGWYFVAVDNGNMGGGPSMSALNITGGPISTSGTPPIISSTDAGNTQFFLSVIIGGSTSGTAPSSAGYTWSWTVGSSTYTTPAFNTTFSAGTYTVDLTGKDGIGVSGSASATETVNADPSVSISSSQNPTDVGNSITFTASASGGTGSYSYQWYLNGNPVSGATSSTYTTSFSSSGTYNIYVVVHDGIGNSAQSNTITETVNPDPSVSISSSQNPTDVGNSVTFTASASGGTGAFSYTWYLNGAVQSSTTSTFSTSFSSPGTYYVNVTIKDSVGDSASYSFTETVYSDPSVSITSSQNPTDIGNSVTFTASPSGGSGSYTYQWYLNGAAVSGATSSTYTTSFSSSGSDSVYVIIKDSVGNSATSNTIDETVNPDPSVSITSSQNPTDIGNSVTFTASPSGGTGSYTYQWYWSNGTAISGATSQSYTTSFSSSGTYGVYVIIKDSVGNSATSNTITETVNTDPSVSISSSQNPTDIGNSVTFTASASGGTGSYSYQWYWSNGTAISGATSYQYTTSFTSSGTYGIYVVVKDANGNTAQSSTLTETVNVDPSVAVSESPSPTDTGVPVTFTASASGGTGSYNYTWTINGATYYAQDPTVTFSEPGTYTASVTIRDSLGDTASASETIVVNHQPSVSISVQYNPVYAGTNDLFRASGSYGTGSYNYTWLNGSAVIGYGAYLTYKFGAPGTYTIEVKIRDGLNQTNTSAVAITADQLPSIYIAGPTNITYGKENYWGIVVNGSIAGGNVYWFVDDINQTADANDVQIGLTFENTSIASFPISAHYIVQGKWYNVSITVRANTPPTAAITAKYTSVDAGVVDLFDPSVSGGSPGYTYRWDIQGHIFNTENVTYSFSSSGSYNVTLTVTDGDGVTATATTVITVNTDPSVSISSSQNPTDIGNSITFTASASGGTGSYSYQWYWSNGTAISGATSYQYTTSFTSSGTYGIYVVVKDGIGYSVESSTLIEAVNADPSSQIYAPRASLDAGQGETFTVKVSNGTSPYKYEWYVNGQALSNSSSFSYSFASPGNYTVEVEITDAVGKTAVSSTTVTVHPDPSVSAKADYSQMDAGYAETFTASGSGGLSPYTYEWVLDGNVISTSASFTYVFNAVGTYTVTVKMTDANGYTVSSNVTVDVVSPPSVSFSVKYVYIDQGVQDEFNATPLYGTSPYNYTWYVNGAIIGYGPSIAHAFPAPGTYYVNVTLRDYFGYTATFSRAVYVEPLPVASIYANRTAIDEGMSVSFLSGVSGGVSPYNYTWEINGAVFAYGADASHAFPSSGSYTITLIVKDSFGEASSASVTITVNAPVSVSISDSASSIDEGMSVSFASHVSGGTSPYTYEWYVNGNLVSSQQDQTYLFAVPGTYTVKLVVIDDLGHNATYSVSVVVNPALHASISVKYPTVDENITDNITLTAANGTPSYTYAVLINGVKVSSSSSYSQYFTKAGTYEITAYVNDSAGESVILRSTITVRPNPSVSIVTPTNRTDANVPIEFRSILANGTGPYTYSWLIAGHTYSNATLTFAFPASGSYVVQLTVTDAFGREAIAEINETVFPDPHASLIAPSRIIASEQEQLSLNISGGIKPYAVQWYFPSGEQFSGANITHAFRSAGPETFEVQVKDASGYVDVQNFSVTVHLYVAIAANETYGFAPLAVQFSSSVLGGSSYAYNWSFGNGHYSLQPDPVYVFPSGNYTVTLSVVASNGATGSASLTVESLPAPVTFLYSPTVNGTILTTFHFEAIPNWDAPGPYSMSWSFPNGQTLTGMNVSYRFPIYNEFNTVIATFKYNGGTYVQYLKVRLYPAPISVSFTLPKVMPVGTLVDVNATVTDPDSSVYTVTWEYMGHSLSGQEQELYFPTVGNYTVSAYVVDSLGATAAYSVNVSILPVSTNANIVIEAHSVVNGPYTTYEITVLSSAPLSIVEAFIGTQVLEPTLVNTTDGYHYNLTLYAGDYPAGTNNLKIVAFTVNGESNFIVVQYFVSSQFGRSQGFSLVSFFGGGLDMVISLLSIVTGIGLSVAFYLDRRSRRTIDLNIGGFDVKAKRSVVDSMLSRLHRGKQNPVVPTGLNLQMPVQNPVAPPPVQPRPVQPPVQPQAPPPIQPPVQQQMQIGRPVQNQLFLNLPQSQPKRGGLKGFFSAFRKRRM
ncbi:hypothetical protein DMB44_05380 [Thermoplasma sp. Kam2015]|uniref:PKD domain-containing protein n=1 Tax=Thermoplasma sp. Kam2015 TaxID=2094122 RepID=UPI000D8BDA1B|nr:PKD domain-containing protein [Thermoplasma sp. Kam2015]PYB68153.1 hypothetical protein DMB44_05380 [Thermoplasma sp. Kam2015]